jgi:hypothetical protein
MINSKRGDSPIALVVAIVILLLVAGLIIFQITKSVGKLQGSQTCPEEYCYDGVFCSADSYREYAFGCNEGGICCMPNDQIVGTPMSKAEIKLAQAARESIYLRLENNPMPHASKLNLKQGETYEINIGLQKSKDIPDDKQYPFLVYLTKKENQKDVYVFEKESSQENSEKDLYNIVLKKEDFSFQGESNLAKGLIYLKEKEEETIKLSPQAKDMYEDYDIYIVMLKDIEKKKDGF